MKKILIFSVAYHPFVGGAEVAVKEITDRISDISFDMVTINLDGKQPSQEKIGNVMVYRIGGPGRLNKLLFPFAAYSQASALHRKNNYDAIWSIMASFSGFAASFFKFRFQKIPFVLTLQEGDPIEYIKGKVGFMYPLYKKIFTQATVIQAISQYLAKFARNMGAQKKIEVIPNGVDIATFSAQFQDAELEKMRKEVGVEKGERVIITTSRLVIKNGIADLINSLEYLPHSVKLIIIGKGNLEADLRKLAEKPVIKNRVIFLGEKSYSEIPKYLAISDVFVRPSLSEGMGNSFIEAMAAGVPIIGTNVGGIPDFLKDGQTGVFCQVHNPRDIAEKIESILNNQILRSHLVSRAREIIKHSYEWQPIAQKMHDMFISIL